MKLSVSLPEDDVRFLDSYADSQNISSRSAVLHRAVRLLRASELGPEYGKAWDEWYQSSDATAWESTISDGLA